MVLRRFAIVAGLVGVTACGTMPAASTSPTSNTITSLVTAGLGTGTFSSTKAVSPQANTCGGFSWSITGVTANSVTGTFSATCNGTLPVAGTGTATASISGSSITWTGAANASIPGNSNCAINLTGSVQVSGMTLTIPYSGTTCFGPVSGTETLTKQ
jgi:hypothetical protein